MKRSDPRQFDMFATIEPPKPVERNLLYEEHKAALAAFEPAGTVSRDEHDRPQVQTRAASHGGLITMYSADAPLPIEVEIRGIPCVISFHGGYATHVIERAGSAFWSETGYRSMGLMLTDPAEIIADIERYIDRPSKDGNGCGGKLKAWWPHWVLQWRDKLAFELGYCKDRATVWDQWGPEKHAEHWANHDAALAEAMQRMIAEGIDPNAVGKPAHFKGKWPTF